MPRRTSSGRLLRNILRYNANVFGILQELLSREGATIDASPDSNDEPVIEVGTRATNAQAIADCMKQMRRMSAITTALLRSKEKEEGEARTPGPFTPTPTPAIV